MDAGDRQDSPASFPATPPSSGSDFTVGGAPQTDDPAAEQGLVGTVTIDSPTPLDIVAIIRSLRGVDGVLFADGQSITASPSSAGRYAYLLNVEFDQTIYSNQSPPKGRRVMPKQLVTVIGLIVSLGVIALGVFLVAMPLYFQVVDVDAQTATVASTNALYQAQVDSLTGRRRTWSRSTRTSANCVRRSPRWPTSMTSLKSSPAPPMPQT